LTTVCLALRIYVRSSLIKAWGLDDTFLVITYVSITLQVVFRQNY